MVNMNTVSSALKNFYIMPLREDVNLKADAFASRIMRTSTNIVGYNKIVRAALVGANGGAGAGSETGALPASGENVYVNLESDTKNLYGTLEISDKIVRSATGRNAGSFVNILQQEMETLTRTLKWNMARQMYGDGSGKLVTVQAATGSAVLTAAPGSSTRHILPGLKVDLYPAAGGTAIATGLRVVDVNHLTGKITLSSAVTCAANAYLTVQGSAGYELTGLGKLFGAANGTLYGLSRASYSWLNPYTADSFGAITESGLQKVIDHLEDSYNVTVNHINCGTEAYGHYLELMTSRRAICDASILEGGHKALMFNGIPLTRSKFMPAAAIDLYDTSLFTIDQVADWEWIEGETRQVLHQKPGYPTYTATVAKYCDLMCALPGGIARLNGVAAPAVKPVLIANAESQPVPTKAISA